MTVWITTILIIITLLAILYTIFKKCRYVSSLPRVCFPLYPFSTILRGTVRTDIFIEVVNLASAEAMWAHFTSIAVHPSQLRITGYPHAYDMHIIKLCCCRQLQIDWQNIVLCDLDRNVIKLPALGKISLRSTNDLASIENNIPYQIRVYGRVLDLVIPLEIKDDVHITDHRLYWAVDNLATRMHYYIYYVFKVLYLTYISICTSLRRVLPCIIYLDLGWFYTAKYNQMEPRTSCI